MTLRNVPITYTLDQQRQVINNLAGDVNDIDVNFNEKVDDRINTLITAGTGIASVYDDTANTYTLSVDFAGFTTTSLTEGVNGLFYTSARAISEIDNRVTKTFVNNLLVSELGDIAQVNLKTGNTTATITANNYNHNNWDTAYSWGDHSQAGYVTSVGAIALNDITDVNVSGIITDGHVLKWDAGTSRWIASPDLSGGGGGGGGGISLTDISVNVNPVGTSTLSYNSTSGAFTYTPPDLSSYSTFSGDWSDLTNKPSVPSSLGDLGDVDTTGAANDKILKHNGTSWVVADDETGGGGGVGLLSRATGATTITIGAGATANGTIIAAKSYALLKIQTSHAAWITLYTDNNARTNDSTRNETTDPLPGQGVIAEIITDQAATQTITPGTIGWNNDVLPDSTVYIKVVNKSGSTADITVTLTYVQLEA